VTSPILFITDLEPRAQGWIWWILLVITLAGVVLLLMGVRRWILRPMPHQPTDTTDAWTEAGRRFHLPPESQKENDDASEETPP